MDNSGHQESSIPICSCEYALWEKSTNLAKLEKRCILYYIFHVSLRNRTLIEIVNLLPIKQECFINVVQYVKRYLLDCKAVSDICHAELNRRAFSSSTASFNCGKNACIFEYNRFYNLIDVDFVEHGKCFQNCDLKKNEVILCSWVTSLFKREMRLS